MAEEDRVPSSDGGASDGGGRGRPERGPALPPLPAGGGGSLVGVLVIVAALLVPAYFLFQWAACRIDVRPGHLGVLIAKTGEDLPDGEIVATRAGQKGIQLETLKPGRHFYNPFLWDWEIVPMVEVPGDKLRVLVRLYGETPDLTQDLLVPLDGGANPKKGIVAEVLQPGIHERINPMAYTVGDAVDPVRVEAGYVGVVCNRVGKNPARPNQYLVGRGERGVQKDVLKPGTHYMNPYAATVVPVDVRSQRLELAVDPVKDMAEDDRTALSFPSSDGFEIEVKLTVEWSIDEARASEVFVRVGTGDDQDPMAEILHKILIPALRGLSRIEGSRYPAANYIAGESRTIFQESIHKALEAKCGEQGILVHSVLVNDIVPPQVIATPIREREVAKEELARNTVQTQQAKANQSLARQTELVAQEKAKVEAETVKNQRKIASEGARDRAVIEQDQRLAVAKADLAAAELEARAILSRGQAEADVIMAQNVAEAEALRASVEAFATPAGFAAYTFALRMAPRIRTVFADPDGAFGAPFQDLLRPTNDAKKEGGR